MTSAVFARTDPDDTPDTEVPASSLDQGIQRWLPEVRSRLEELLSLKRGWDSFEAPPVDPENAQAALELLQLIMGDDTQPPEIVPTGGGGVQLEWGSGDCFLEVEVTSRTHFLCLDSFMEEFAIRFDVSPLRDRVARFRVISD